MLNGIFSSKRFQSFGRELTDSVVECLTRDRKVVGLSVTELWSLSKTHLSELSTGATQ